MTRNFPVQERDFDGGKEGVNDEKIQYINNRTGVVFHDHEQVVSKTGNKLYGH